MMTEQEIEKLTGMTEAEADALDDYFTKNPPVPDSDPTKVGVTGQSSFRLIAVDSFTEKYLVGKALATHKTPAAIIAELVRKSVAAAAL
jgi:hypothetical protein